MTGHKNRRQPVMGKGVVLYEQIYNDLTATVARAKLACKKRKKPKTIAAPDKKNRGRPKGSKDAMPRKAKAKAQTENVLSGGPDGLSDSSTWSESDHMFCSGFSQSVADSVPYEAAWSPLHSEIKFFDTLVASGSPTEISQAPSCWELPLP